MNEKTIREIVKGYIPEYLTDYSNPSGSGDYGIIKNPMLDQFLHSLYKKIKGEMPKKKKTHITLVVQGTPELHEYKDTQKNEGYNQYHDEMLVLLANLFE